MLASHVELWTTVETILGSVCVLVALFTVKTEEDKLRNQIYELWARAATASDTATSKHSTARIFAVQMFDRLLGRLYGARRVSVRGVWTAMIMSFASLPRKAEPVNEDETAVIRL